jgi:hypothetical protein
LRMRCRFGEEVDIDIPLALPTAGDHDQLGYQ